MGKQAVDVKKLLQDIRAGMTDTGLRAKYGFSVGELNNLMGKLAKLGFIRQISAKDLLREIRAGITNRGLMEKYNLTPEALGRLLVDMMEANIPFFPARQNAGGSQKINVRQLVADIRSGATETDLMKKYSLSPRGLQSAFWKLVRAGIVSWDELLCPHKDFDDTVTLEKNRQWPRCYPILVVEVYDEQNPVNRGKVLDLSEKGIGTLGVETTVGQEKTLMLVPDDFTDIKPFAVRAECRWANKLSPKRLMRAGFEIVGVDSAETKDLQDLLQVITVTFQ